MSSISTYTAFAAVRQYLLKLRSMVEFGDEDLLQVDEMIWSSELVYCMSGELLSSDQACFAEWLEFAAKETGGVAKYPRLVRQKTPFDASVAFRCMMAFLNLYIHDFHFVQVAKLLQSVGQSPDCKEPANDDLKALWEESIAEAEAEVSRLEAEVASS